MKSVAYKPAASGGDQAPALTNAVVSASDSKIPPPSNLGANTSVLAKSEQGELAIYAKDTNDELTLIFQKGSNEPETVFENKRR